MSDVTTETIGKTLDETARRDAVHIALAPVIAEMRLSPGQHVGLNQKGHATVPSPGQSIGIVDPFLGGPVSAGERFWLFLYPMTITSLRHEWTHPAFGEEAAVTKRPEREASERWLRDFVAHADCPSYEAVIAAAIGQGAKQWDSGYLYFDGVEAHGEIPPEFWDHVEVVTGVKIPRDQRAAYFSCGC